MHVWITDACCFVALVLLFPFSQKDLFDKQHKRAASGDDSASAPPTKKAKKVDPIETKAEERKQRNVERNARRKKMRTEQKVEKQNR